MDKIIIGVVGEMGSGKSTVARYLKEKYGASGYTFSDMLKYILDYLQLPITRDNLIDLFLVLAPRFGEDVLARPMKAAVAADAQALIVVEGIRREADIAELRSLPGFYLLGVKADVRVCYERINVRGQRADDAEKTYEEFVKDHEKQTETGIAAMVKGADFRIENDGNVEEMYAKIKAVMTELKAK